MKKRFVAFLLVLIMVLGMLPVSAMAALATGHKISIKVYKVVLDSTNYKGYQDPVLLETKEVTCNDGTSHSGSVHFANRQQFHPDNVTGASTTGWVGYQFAPYYTLGNDLETFYSWKDDVNLQSDANVTGSEPYPCSKNFYLVYKDSNPEVTYTDGVEDEVIFEDWVRTGLKFGDATPRFGKDPFRRGYTFAGWQPAVAEKVTETVIYTAQWTPVEPKAPTADELKKPEMEMAVQVKCVVDDSQEHTYGYGLLGECDGDYPDYFVGEPKKVGDDWLCDISYDPELYVAEFNKEFPNPKHVQNDEKIVPVTLIWDRGSWQVRTQGRVHVTEEYTVTFNAYDGFPTPDEQHVKSGEKAVRPVEPTLKGFTFDGWYLGEAEKPFDFDNTTITSDITLTAKWNINKYTVAFNTDGGTPVPPALEVEYGLTATEPDPAPTKTGYTFTGWYLGDEKYDFSAAVEQNITLTAKWSPATVYLFVRPVDSTGKNLLTGANALLDSTLEKAGFTGGYNAGDRTYITVGKMTTQYVLPTYPAATVITDGKLLLDVVNELGDHYSTYDKHEDALGFNAKDQDGLDWYKLEYMPATSTHYGYEGQSEAYHLNGLLKFYYTAYENGLPDGSTETVDNMPKNNYGDIYDYYIFNNRFTLPANEPTREGYTFLGWKAQEIDDGGAVAYANRGSELYKPGETYGGEYSGIRKDVVFTAQWEAKKANVHLMIFKSGDLSKPIVDVPYTTDKLAGETLDLTALDPKTYLTFDFEIDGGWYDDGLFNLYKKYVNGEQANKPVALTELQINGNWQNLKLIVTEMVPVVYFDSLESLTAYQNDHSKTEGILHTTKARVGSTLPTADAPTATREGYTFTFWSREGQTVDVTGQTVNGWTNLYANWKANSYTVTFAPNGGEGTMTDQTFTYDVEQALTANAFTKTGYTFAGWKDGSGNSYIDGQTVKNLATEGTVTLTAQWTPNTYKYEIHYYVQQPDGSYVEDASALDTTKSGTFDSTVTVTPDANKYGAHFSVNNIKSKLSGVVTVDTPAEILKLEVYYDRDFHTLTYLDFRNGSVIGTTTVRCGVSVAAPKDPTKAGYWFDGWYNAADNKKVTFPVTLTNNMTVYAGWTMIVLPSTIAKKTPKLNTADHFAYVQGYPDGTVKPAGNITRAETAAILFRLMDDTSRNNYYSTKSGFRDVASGTWYNTYVATLNNAGVITDSANGYFRPNDAITRAELAAMLAAFTDTTRAANYFNDVTANYWAANAIAVCAKLGWITGYPDGSFRPDRNVTRAELMAMINRATGRAPKSADAFLPGMKTWSDNTADKWYYLDVQEATNSHSYTVRPTEIWTAITAAPNWSKYE